MQPICSDRMRIARELLDYGVLAEGAEKLAELHDCGRRVGCDHWRRCTRTVERLWEFSGGVGRTREVDA